MSFLVNLPRLRAAGLVAAGLALTLAGSACVVPAPAPPSPPAAPEVTTTDLPELILYIDTPAVDINNHGQIVGVRAVDGETRIVIWEDGELTDVGPYSSSQCPTPDAASWCGAVNQVTINDLGQVGTVVDRHAVLWQDGRFVDLDGDAEMSRLLDLNQRGQALVLRFAAGQQILGLWSRGRFEEIANAPWEPTGQVLGGRRLSDRGHVLVTQTPGSPSLPIPGRCPSSFLWHRGERRELGMFTGVDVNRHGQVLGHACEEVDGSIQSLPVLWDDGEITPLTGLGGDYTYVDDLDDRGQVVGVSTLPGTSGFHAVLWDDGEITDIGAGTGGWNTYPVVINDRGQVLIRSSAENGAGTGFVWDEGDLIRLPPVDDPWTTVDPDRMNDRGQIVGRRSVGLGPTIPMLWEVRQPRP